jgi:pyruvate/2-oxoglutarate dehydrogenase complex dihydrolipoamide acyltransferase (E2) component
LISCTFIAQFAFFSLCWVAFSFLILALNSNCSTREHKAKTGESLSFTAFLIACLAQAVDEHKAVQAIRFGKKHLILFDEVDVYTLIERNVAGQKQPLPYIVRAANHKTMREIHQEIRAAQVQDVAKALKRFEAFQFLPDLLFRPFFWVISWIGSRYPQVWKESMGTVALSAVGMFEKGASWGIPPVHPTSLWVTVGGIGEKPGGVDGQIVMRNSLSLTISFDHDIVDGAPAARFTQRLKDLIESGYGLFDSTVEPEPVAAEDVVH